MKLEDRISTWLRDYLIQSKLDCFVIGISGGIDSAVVSTLCATTKLPTIVISMPIHQPADQLYRAEKHIEWLKKNYKNVQSYEINLSDTYESFKSVFHFSNDLALANSRSRLRMMALYQIATEYNGIVVGTGNKVEDFGVGFFTKYGDGGVDISPIADLYKTEVWELGRNLNIDSSIIEAKPTDGLWGDNRSDEDQIGATYPELEWAMEFDGDPLQLSGRNKEIYDIYIKLNTKNQHKMIPIPIFKKL